MLIVLHNANCIRVSWLCFGLIVFGLGMTNFVCKGLVRKKCSSLDYMGDANLCLLLGRELKSGARLSQGSHGRSVMPAM